MTNGSDIDGEESPRPAFQFGLRDLLGLMVIVAVLVATTVYYWDIIGFGHMVFMVVLAEGLFCYLFYLATWRTERRRRLTLRAFVVIATLAYVGSCMLASGIVDPRWAVRRWQCRHNMKYILLALHNYHDAYGSFPPAYVPDEDGKPMHSWRVLILPFIEEQALYNQYDFSEPWDGPNNRKLLATQPYQYRCPEQSESNAAETNYVAVVGPRTAWPGDKATENGDFVDGHESTLMIVEVVDSGIAWTEPKDLSIQQALEGLQQEGGLAIASDHRTSGRLLAPTGAVLGYADGHVEFMTEDLPPDQWKAAFQLNDNQ